MHISERNTGSRGTQLEKIVYTGLPNNEDYQGLPKITRDYQRLQVITEDYQGFPKTTREYQGGISSYRGPKIILIYSGFCCSEWGFVVLFSMYPTVGRVSL
jgi:hypothetical protein